MIDKIQLTLYEIFGYFLPGTLVTVALLIGYWALCLPNVAFPAYKIHPDASGWIALVGISYLMGHLTQGIGNHYLRGAEVAALGNQGIVPRDIRDSGRNRAAQLMGVDPASVDAVSLFRFVDEYSVQKGLPGDRDIFVYREGFYKGCTIALALLCGALFLRAICQGTAIKMPTYTYFISRNQIFAAAILSAIAARICRQRFYRFGAYRVNRALFAFLALYAPQKKSTKEGSADA